MQSDLSAKIDNYVAYEASPPLADGTESIWSLFFSRSLHSGIASIFDQAVVSATNFATMLIIARLCTKDELGVYYLAWTLVLFIVAVQGNLISVPYTIYCSRREGQSLAAYAGSTLVHQLLTSALAIFFILILTIMFLFGLGPPALQSVGWVLLGAVPFILLREYARRFLFAHLNLSSAIVMDVSVSCIQLSGLLILAYFNLLTVPKVYVIMGVASAFSFIIWYLTNRRPIYFIPDRFIADWRENWQFGKWALASQLTGLSFYILPWLLAMVHSEADTGVFAAGNTLVGLANPFIIGLCNFLTPKAAQAYVRDGNAGLSRVLRKTTIVFTVSLGSFCLMAFIAGNFLAWFAFGAKYQAAGPIIGVLSIATILDGLGLTANNGLWAIDRPAANFPADIAQLIFTLGAALWLVFPFGAMGIAVAIVVGRAAGTSVRWIVLRGLMYSGACQTDIAP